MGAISVVACCLFVGVAVFAASLIPFTSAAFAALERSAAGSVVAVMFARYSLIQAGLILAALGAGFAARSQSGMGLVVVAALMLALHGGWEYNRRSVASQKEQIAAYTAQLEEASKDPKQDQQLAQMRKSFGIAHGVSMLVLLAVIVLALGAVVREVWRL